MKKIALLISAVMLIITGCEKEKGYYLSGEVEGIENGKKVYIAELDSQTGSPKVVDTAVVQNGKFELDPKEQELPNLKFLILEGVSGNLVFIAENQEIEFKIYKDSIRSSVVKGGKENEALKEYLDHLKELGGEMAPVQRDMRFAMRDRDTARLSELRQKESEIMGRDIEAKEDIFNKYSDSFVSVMVLSDMLGMKSHSSGEVREFYKKLPEELKETALAATLKKNLDQMGEEEERLKAAEIGKKAPEFSAPNPEGEEISLSNNLGKVTVVDFWAAWCKPCRVENPNLVRTYNKYKDQGLNIISVSLDRPGQKDRWIQAIQEDNLEQWDHVSNLQFWNDPIARKYGVSAIPATFVLDENGVIVAKNLRGDQLANKIGELLN